LTFKLNKREDVFGRRSTLYVCGIIITVVVAKMPMDMFYDIKQRYGLWTTTAHNSTSKKMVHILCIISYRKIQKQHDFYLVSAGND
jgi:hypothetical protein